MGDANASIPTVQPVISRPMWGSFAESAAINSLVFVSEVSIRQGKSAPPKRLSKEVSSHLSVSTFDRCYFLIRAEEEGISCQGLSKHQ
jgi:urease alpha subunit